MPPCAEQAADIHIVKASPGKDWATLDLPNSFANWRAGPNRLLLSVEHVAQYLIEDGNRISIAPADGADPGTISAFLTGSAFAVILQQRGFLTTHASGVIGPNGAILFVGRSGVGKSTTLAAMDARDLPMVTDDVAAITFDDDGTPFVTPSFSGGRITRHSLAELGKSTDEFRKLDAEIEKYAVPIALTAEPSVRLDRIVVLDAWEQPHVALSALSKGEAFLQLSYYTFRKRFYDGMEMSNFHFDAITKLVADTPVMKANRPDDPFLLDELVDAILNNAAGGESANQKTGQNADRTAAEH